MNVGLISKADHRNMNWFLIITLVVTIGGFVYQIYAWPDKIPQQVIEFAPPQPELPELATATGITSEFADDTVTMTVELENTGEDDMEILEFTTSTLSFVNPDVREATGQIEEMTVEPSESIGPGETAEVTLTMPSERWESDQLIPTAESQLAIFGTIVVESGSDIGFAEVNAPLTTDFSADN
jgi:methane/ammonia monooxygenase subunit B